MRNFMNMLRGLNDPAKLQAVNIILARFRQQLAIDDKFYDDPTKINPVRSYLMEHVEITDPFLNALLQIESAGPYSIFSYIMNENFSDIIIHKNGFIMSDNLNTKRYEIDPQDLPVYHMFMEHFIENIMFVSGKKFDPSNAILDAEIGLFRFNLIHNSLTVNHHNAIVIRKQTIRYSKKDRDPKQYIESIGVTPRQLEAIHKYSMNGNVIVFGPVGSGKTTLVKYMGNYGLDEKRNLCTIEDTSELNLNVPLALVTNNHKKIKDLFVASLRENPSHIIIGETRTDEIVDILEASLTVSVLTTIHANSLPRAIQRIIFMSARRGITPENMSSLISASVDLWIHMDDRKVKEVWEHTEAITGDIYSAYQKIE